MSIPSGSAFPQVQSGVPAFGIVNTVRSEYVKPVAVDTGQPVIEITCSVCQELTSRTYPIEVNGEAVPSAPNEKYLCSCPSP